MSTIVRCLLLILTLAGLVLITHEAIIFFNIHPFASNSSTKQKSLIDPKPKFSSLPAPNAYHRLKALEQAIRNDLAAQPGDYAIFIQDLSKKEDSGVRINDSAVFEAASLYKLFLLAAALEAEEQGQLSDDDILSSSHQHLIEVLGSADYGYQDYQDSDQISFTVSQALDRIARLSDNYSSIMLAEKIGWQKVQDQADLIGASQTTIKAPISTSASDIGLFLTKLYRKQIVSEAASNRLIDLLARDQINNRIPAKLPDELKIAHKTGELSKVRHDAGIVFLEARPYLIVLMSQNVKYEDSAVDLLAQISKDTYDYFNKGS